ncbi:MAG: carboxymuconolactone decarboxylase family protein [Phycisphaeraceae bacterium]
MKVPTLTPETAPETARDLLSAVNKKLGFTPNLLGKMAHAPSVLKAYLQLSELFSQTSLSPVQRHVVLLSISRENGCHYCMAAHSALAKMDGVDHEVVESLREGKPIGDEALEALAELAVELVERRGWPKAETLDRFLASGYTQAQVLEVILGVAFKTLSNYCNHVLETEVDPQFAPHTWQPAET